MIGIKTAKAGNWPIVFSNTLITEAATKAHIILKLSQGILRATESRSGLKAHSFPYSRHPVHVLCGFFIDDVDDIIYCDNPHKAALMIHDG